MKVQGSDTLGIKLSKETPSIFILQRDWQVFQILQNEDKESSERRFNRQAQGRYNIVDTFNVILQWALEKGSI